MTARCVFAAAAIALLASTGRGGEGEAEGRDEAKAEGEAKAKTGEAGGGEARGKGTQLDELVVVSTGFPSPLGAATLPVTVVEGSWYEEHGVVSLSEGLRQVPGVAVSRGGTPGAATSLFLRGAGSNQVLVLQDGMPLNDPTVGGQFNFFDLDVLNLERVEVLRGSYGALYGSSAIGGVVNLVSRRGEGPARFTLSAEGGSFHSRRETLSGAGGEGGFDWSFGVAEAGTAGPHDRQGFRSVSLSGLFGARVGEDGRAEVAVRWLDSTGEDPYDFGNPLVPDGNIRRERETAAIGASLEKPLAPWATLRVRASSTDIDSAFRNGSDAAGGTVPEFQSTSEATTTFLGAAVQAALPPAEGRAFEASVVAGGDWREEESLGFSESSFGGGLDLDGTVRNAAGYLLATLEAGPATVTGGGRYDEHGQAGGEWSPQAGARVGIDRTATVLRANYGQGFRAPTLSEFADPFVGNPDLGPEESVSWDAGVEQGIGEGAAVEATWFRLRTRDLIAFDPSTFLLGNLARTETEGVEVAARADAGAGWRVRASWTHQRPRDLATGDRLPNRPDDFASAGAEWTRGAWTAAADLYWQGAVDDLGVRGPDQDLRDHAGRRLVVGLAGRYRATGRLALFARVENLLGEEYVETPTAPKGLPFSAFLGASLEF